MLILAICLIVQALWVFILTWMVATTREQSDRQQRRIEELERRTGRWLPDDGKLPALEPLADAGLSPPDAAT